MTEERWLPVVGWEGLYEVSNQGQVRSLTRVVYAGPRTRKRQAEGRLRKLVLGKRGHLVVTLCRDGAYQLRYVHHLVLEAFIGPRPAGTECCHANDVKTDNRLANLRWDTQSANMHDRVRNGIHPMALKTHCKRGHPFDEANTYIIPGSGSRQCRECTRDRGYAYRARKAHFKRLALKSAQARRRRAGA